ncbi:MAG: hypothetical protein EHM70_09465 [Chloroflexota bacterium]|nr:MAG: hypothetical protein EHM70_09465 [Chloroflexota bacterium]
MKALRAGEGSQVSPGCHALSRGFTPGGIGFDGGPASEAKTARWSWRRKNAGIRGENRTVDPASENSRRSPRSPQRV